MSLAEKLIPPILKNLYVMWFLPLHWQTNGHVLGKGGYYGINISIYFINLNNLTHNNEVRQMWYIGLSNKSGWWLFLVISITISNAM